MLDGLAFDQWLLLQEEPRSLRQGVAVPRIDGLRLGSDTHFRHPPVDLCRGAAALLPGLTGNDIEREGPTGCGFGRTKAFSGPASNWSRAWTVPTDPKLETALGNPRLSVLGIVWNKVDDIMHGMQMQTAGMHNQVRLWASQGHLQQLLVRLQQEGFVVYLTADHGNVTATGIGNPREGVLVETRGQAGPSLRPA